jgi:hypothetical protein
VDSAPVNGAVTVDTGAVTVESVGGTGAVTVDSAWVTGAVTVDSPPVSGAVTVDRGAMTVAGVCVTVERLCVTGAATVDSAPVVELVVGVEPVPGTVTFGRVCVTGAVTVDNAPNVVAGLVGVIVFVTPLDGELVVELIELAAERVVGAEPVSGAVMAEKVCLTGMVTVDTVPLLVVGVVELIVGATELVAGVLELVVEVLELEVIELAVGVEPANGAARAERVCLTGVVTVDTDGLGIDLRTKGRTPNNAGADTDPGANSFRTISPSPAPISRDQDRRRMDARQPDLAHHPARRLRHDLTPRLRQGQDLARRRHPVTMGNRGHTVHMTTVMCPPPTSSEPAAPTVLAPPTYPQNGL